MAAYLTLGFALVISLVAPRGLAQGVVWKFSSPRAIFRRRKS